MVATRCRLGLPRRLAKSANVLPAWFVFSAISFPIQSRKKVALVPAEIPEQPLGIPDNPEVVVLEFVEIEPTKHLPNFVHGAAQSEEGGVDGTGGGAPNTTYP